MSGVAQEGMYTDMTSQWVQTRNKLEEAKMAVTTLNLNPEPQNAHSETVAPEFSRHAPLAVNNPSSSILPCPMRQK